MSDQRLTLIPVWRYPSRSCTIIFNPLSQRSVEELSEILALYLKSYRDVKISIDGRLIDPSTSITSSKSTVPADINGQLQSIGSIVRLTLL
jgi:hypothetical protein